jgi:mannose-6-phosphate isomerase
MPPPGTDDASDQSMTAPTSAPFTESQRADARQFISYVFRDMARLWATKGWNEAGRHGVERLQADLTPAPLGYRRSMVVGRQLFFFSQAFRVTGDAMLADRARALFADLTGRFWDAEHGGWHFSLDDAGRPADTTKDLYGHAFVMFGLAHYAAIFKTPDAIDWARRTNALVRRHLMLPQGWFAETASRDWTPLNRALEQNPHMHLLEAYLSLYATTRDADFLRDAQHMVAIYTEKLRSPDGAKVLEHFDSEGRPHAEKGRLIQPGHLYEWAWLLNEYADFSGLAVYRESPPLLIDWADARGVDSEHGGIYFHVDDTGVVVNDRKRIWPVTECIKAYATLARQRGDAKAYATFAGWIDFITKTYFTGPGAAHEYVRRDLTPDSDYLPGSTPYHIAMAALEAERLLGGPGAFNLPMLSRS